MGTGPPVCKECLLFLDYDHGWKCPKCGTPDGPGMFCLSDAELIKLDENCGTNHYQDRLEFRKQFPNHINWR